MPTPLSNRPKITPQDILNGYVMRYFTQLALDTSRVIEIDERQYNIFKSDTRYKTTRFPWIIGGNAFDTVTPNGTVIPGTRTKNANIIKTYTKQVKNLDRYVPDVLEFFVGTTTPPAELVPQEETLPTTNGAIPEEVVVAVATAISVSPTSLTFNYQIGSTVPNSQSISVTADGDVSNLYIASSSSWISASLMSTSTPTTVWLYPVVTGLYSGSYSSIVTVDSIQSGIDAKTISITLNVTNNPDILFIYEPGMSLSSATFTRATSASYNELVS